MKTKDVKYFSNDEGLPIKIPGKTKVFISRIFLPLLTLLSRDSSLKIGLTPIDDERVIVALKNAYGRVIDVGCGSNYFTKSYQGEGIGVDVFPWVGVDKVIKDASKIPFKDKSFDTVSFLACLNHIPNRNDAVKEAHRLLKKEGIVIVTMVPPLFGRFIHWIRFRNDPDHQDRDIDHDHELLGMHSTHVKSILKDAGFKDIKQKRFVFGINSVFIGKK